MTDMTFQIVGTAQVGQLLSAQQGLIFQWYRSGVAIAGATSPVYTLVEADVGNALTVSRIDTSIATSPVIDIIPTNSAVPTISGTARVGQTLTATTGTWTHNPTSFTYQWNRAGGAISGATASSYVSVTGDIGTTLTVSVVATNTGGSSSPATSAPTSAVIDIIPANSSVPTISGAAQVGQTLTATTGTWTHNPTSFTYQWNRAGGAISGAAASSYVPVTVDIGTTLTVSVVATNAGGSSSRATSSATSSVIDIIPTNSAVPTISGTARVGQTLRATTGTWTHNPTSYAYQWNSSAGGAISGATAATYIAVTGDIGNTLTVSVVATNSGGSSTPATKAATSAVIDIIPVNSSVPTISGTARVGQTLTATTGTWTHNPTSYAYQWNSSAGGAISGATAATYVAVTGDIGNTLAVSVVATNSGGSSFPATSAATAAAIAAVIPVNTAPPAITGVAQVGQTLSATTGTWINTPVSFTYQWQREGVNIPGATSSTYTLVTADLGALITVKVIASNIGGGSLPARSALAGNSAGLIKIMPLGDSITQGFNSLGGYREPLWYRLQNDGYNISYVGSGSSNGTTGFPFPNHEGHGGYTISGAGVGGTTNIQNGVDTLNWLSVQPDVILLLVGINDFFAGRSTAQANADYSALIDDILGKLPSVKIICGSLVQFNGWVDTFNSNLATLVGTKGSRVSFVDLRAALTSSDLLPDNTHPNQGGYNKLAPVWETGVKAIAPVAPGPIIGTTVFYVSQSAGNDAWDGTTPAFVSGTTGPWQTITKVNGATLAAGTSVLFKRGDTWRDGSGGTASGLKTAQLRPKSGTNGNPIVYDAYGTGPNPRFLGSVAASTTGDWTNTSGNIWTSNSVFQPVGGTNGLPVENANDVGLVTWGTYPNRSIASMVDLPGQSDASLTTQGKWLFNTTDWKVHMYSVGNPATAMPGLELGVDADMIWGYGISDVIVQNLTLFNGAGHGIPYGGVSNRITIRDCIIGFIGGGNLGGGGTRYGNGTQISGGGTFCTVERCWIFECYDGGITQEDFSNTNITFDNLTYRNNVVYNCPTLIELNLGNNAGNVMSNIFCYNNTCPNPTGNTNRPLGNGNNHVCLNPSGVVPTGAFNVQNNSFTFGGIGLNIQNYTWGQGLAVFDYNNWNMANAVHSNSPALDTSTIAQWAAAYSPAAETHGLLQTAPQYVDSTLGDVDPNNLAPTAGSPLLNAGVNLFNAGVVWDFNKKPRPSSGPFTIGAFQ